MRTSDWLFAGGQEGKTATALQTGLKASKYVIIHDWVSFGLRYGVLVCYQLASAAGAVGADTEASVVAAAGLSLCEGGGPERPPRPRPAAPPRTAPRMPMLPLCGGFTGALPGSVARFTPGLPESHSLLCICSTGVSGARPRSSAFERVPCPSCDEHSARESCQRSPEPFCFSRVERVLPLAFS